MAMASVIALGAVYFALFVMVIGIVTLGLFVFITLKQRFFPSQEVFVRRNETKIVDDLLATVRNNNGSGNSKETAPVFHAAPAISSLHEGKFVAKRISEFENLSSRHKDSEAHPVKNPETKAKEEESESTADVDRKQVVPENSISEDSEAPKQMSRRKAGVERKQMVPENSTSEDSEVPKQMSWRSATLSLVAENGNKAETTNQQTEGGENSMESETFDENSMVTRNGPPSRTRIQKVIVELYRKQSTTIPC